MFASRSFSIFSSRYFEAMANSQGLYRFPKLKTVDIVRELKTIGIFIMKDHILHPQRPSTEALFRSILVALESEDSLNLLKPQAGQSCDPMYREGLELFNLATVLKRRMDFIFIENFCVMDIVQPTRGRLIFILSGVLNWLRYRNTLDDFKASIDAGSKEKTERLQALTAANDQLGAVLNQQHRELAEKEAGRVKDIRRSQDLDRKIVGIKQEAEQVKERTERMKDAIVQRAAEIDSKKVTLTGLEERVVFLSRSVISPEEAKSHLQQEQILSGIKEQLAILESTDSSVQKKASETMATSAAVHGTMEMADAALARLPVLRQTEKEIMATTKEVERCEGQLKAAHLREAGLQHAMSEGGDKKLQRVAVYQTRLAGLEQTLSNITKDYESGQQLLERQKTEDRVALNAENQQLESQLDCVRTEYKENMALIKDTRSKLFKKVKEAEQEVMNFKVSDYMPM